MAHTLSNSLQIINYVESTTLYENNGQEGESEQVDLDQLEVKAQEQVLPFMRIASLIMHYVFNTPLPVIELDESERSTRAGPINKEFRMLAEYLEILSKATGEQILSPKNLCTYQVCRRDFSS